MSECRRRSGEWVPMGDAMMRRWAEVIDGEMWYEMTWLEYQVLASGDQTWKKLRLMSRRPRDRSPDNLARKQDETL